MRNVLRSTLLAGVTGSLVVAAAWAGIGTAPVPTPTVPPVPNVAVPGATTAGRTALTVATTTGSLPALGQGQILAGASKSSIAPRPDLMKTKGFPNAAWETRASECKKLAPETIQKLLAQTQTEIDHLAAAGSPWPENPSCIYQGGFSIGPVNPVSSFDAEYGLWVRSVAFSDGTDTIVLTVVDGEGWLWDYAQKCTDCGAKQIADALSKDPELAARNVTAKSFVLHATHSHAAPDFIGGWGFVPNWYMAQVTETIKATAKQAVLSMVPAVLETGEQEARANNSERRDTYRSAEEQQLSWVRALTIPAADPDAKKKDPAPQPEVIATVGAYAAHPTTKGTNGGVAHADWPGLFDKRLEERFGGIGLHFMTGLGNISASGGTAMGTRLADLVPAVGDGRLVDSTDLVLAQTTWQQPVTNAPLDALGTPGFFDRQFDPMPATVRTGKKADTAPCVSAAPQSVELPVTAARIGDDIVLTTAPGEVFSNVTNTIKEKNPGRITFPIAQSNDALGYMPQSFELHPVGQQGLGFGAGGYLFVNYEDSYAVDRCVGDMVLETTLSLLGTLK